MGMRGVRDKWHIALTAVPATPCHSHHCSSHCHCCIAPTVTPAIPATAAVLLLALVVSMRRRVGKTRKHLVEFQTPLESLKVIKKIE